MHEPYFRDIPGSRTAVLMVHGIVGTPDHFKFLMPTIPDNWTVHNILLPGHGGSVDDFASSSMDAWRSYVRREAETLSTAHENLVIIAHSMGTLFALQESLRASNKVRLLFLLNPPLKVFPRPKAVLNALSASFGVKDSSAAMVTKLACSAELPPKLWKYAKWIPRYLELFREIRSTRAIVPRVTAPTRAFLSKKDELVLMGSMKYLKENPDIMTTVLPNSAHFLYSKHDAESIVENLRAAISSAGLQE